MNNTTVEFCKLALDALNASYGKGKVSNVKLCLDGTGTFEQAIYTGQHSMGRPRVLNFRINHTKTKLTVYALRHQHTLPVT